MFDRSVSAPPVNKIRRDGENFSFDSIEKELNRINFNFGREAVNLSRKIFLDDNLLFRHTERDNLIKKAFSETKTAVQKIDSDYPDGDKCIQFVGRSRTGTPIGDKSFDFDFINTSIQTPVTIPIAVNSMYKELPSPFISEIIDFYKSVFSDRNEDYKDICVQVCKDQDGSRFIQTKMEIWTEEQTSYFYTQIVDCAFDLSTNLFGNYVIQKIIPKLSQSELTTLVVQFYNHVYELSVHVYGCRVIQKLIDHVNDISFVVEELQNHISDLIESPNGNHVIQKCIDKNIDKNFIIKEFENDCISLAQQRYGCRVLQRLFEVCDEKETLKLYTEIIDRIPDLINDKYGNYVIQHLIQSENIRRDEIFDYIIKNSVELSKHKFSSNVIEKCVNNSTKAQLENFLIEFSKLASDGKPCLFHMCTDMYANYVVQRFFDTADPELRERAKKVPKKYIREMKVVPFTKHILSRLSN